MSVSPSRVAELGTGCVGVATVIMQFVQSEDRTFALLYFTVDSVLLFSIGLLLPRNVGVGLKRRVIDAGAAGVMVSAFVFWFVLAPKNGIGTQVATQAANLGLHGLIPVLVVTLKIGKGASRRRLLDLTSDLWFPIAYLATVTLPGSQGAWKQPYTFMDPAQIGWENVFAVMVGIAVLYLSMAYLLNLLSEIPRRSRFA